MIKGLKINFLLNWVKPIWS